MVTAPMALRALTPDPDTRDGNQQITHNPATLMAAIRCDRQYDATDSKAVALPDILNILQ